MPNFLKHTKYVFVFEFFAFICDFILWPFIGHLSITRFLLSCFLLLNKAYKGKYICNIEIIHPNFFGESSYGNYLQVLKKKFKIKL